LRAGSLFLTPFFSPALLGHGCGSAALACDTLLKQQVSLLAGYMRMVHSLPNPCILPDFQVNHSQESQQSRKDIHVP